MTPDELVKHCQADSKLIPKAIYSARQELKNGGRSIVQAFARAGRTDLAIFSLFFFSHRIRRNVPDFHREFYDSYKAGHGDPDILYMLPRFHGKSETGTFILPIHGIAYYDEESWQKDDLRLAWGHRYVVIGSESVRTSKKFLGSLKKELTPNKYNDLFLAAFTGDPEGTFKPDDKSTPWQSEMIVTRNEVMIECVGRGTSIRGTKYWYYRPSLLIVDDAEGKKSVTTENIIIETRNWYREDLSEIRDSDVDYAAPRIIIGTVVDENCLVEHLRKTASKEVGGTFKVIYHTAIENEGTKEERALWEVKKPLRILKRDRATAEREGWLTSWLQEYMHIARSKAEKPFHPEDFKYWDGSFHWDEQTEVGFLKIRSAYDANHNETQFPQIVPVSVVGSVDLATSESLSADFTVVLAQGIDYYGNVFVIDWIMKRITTPVAQLNAVFDMHQKYHFERCVIETVAYQNSFANLVNEAMGEKGVYFTMIPEPHKAQINKTQRMINTLEPRVKRKLGTRGCLYFPANNHSDLYKQFSNVPSKGEHDDLPDAAEMGIRYGRKCRYSDLPVLDFLRARKDRETRREPSSILTAA